MAASWAGVHCCSQVVAAASSRNASAATARAATRARGQARQHGAGGQGAEQGEKECEAHPADGQPLLHGRRKVVGQDGMERGAHHAGQADAGELRHGAHYI
ncbi:hypothetical protein OkiPb01551_13520 [Bordetella pertussis]|nr:hypothetical protein BPJ_30610 [Bordetella pertussis]BDT09061.1 hypothetical protein BP3J_27650 [Bordetella pertussis]